MHYYKHNIADYRKDTRFLTPLQHWAYRELIDEYYLSEQPITKNLTDLFWRMGANTDELQEAIQTVLKGFFTETEDGFIHKRCEVEMEDYKEFLGSRSRGGKAAAAKAKLKKEQELNISAARVEHVSSKPQTKKQELEILSPKFDLFWEAWPSGDRKVNRAACLKVWIKNNLEEIGDKIVDHVSYLTTTRDWIEGFVPMPLTYLNQKRYEVTKAAARTTPIIDRRVI